MARVKRGVVAGRRHKKILKKAKGYFNARRKVFRTAKQAVIKAGQYAYRGRREKKREFRALWITRINAAARLCGLTYSTMIDGLSKAGLAIDRKVGEHLAVDGQTRLAQPVNHRAVGQPAQPSGGVDARDPQRAELALLLAPSAIRVLAGLDDGLLGRAEHLAPGIEITLRLLEDFLVASTCDDTAFNSCHIPLTPAQANGSICFTRFMSV